MRKLITLMFFFGFISFCAGQRPFTAGNVVVYRVGDGSATLSQTLAPVFLDEYTPSGTLVQSIAMPVSQSGSNNMITALGSSFQEGMLNISANGKYLVLTGYKGTLGTPTRTGRVIGLVDYNGTINTSTAVTDFASTPTSAISDNGTNLWFGGSGSVRYTTVGASSSTELDPESIGNLNIANGQLYATSEDNVIVGKVGSGIPTTSGQTISALPGIPLLEGYQFAFADLNPNIPGPDVLYIATDISLDNTGGIQKYSLVNGSWVFNGGIGDFSDNYNGLTVKVSGTSVTVFATRKGINSASGGDLVSITDNSGYNGSFAGAPTIIASVSSVDKMAFRGIALVPQPAPYTAGNVVVYRVGDGSTILSQTLAPIFLDEYSPSGALVQSIKMPVSQSGNNNMITALGSAYTEGMLNLSANGKYLVLTGYKGTLGTSTRTGRVMGLVDYNGTINTSTSVTDFAGSPTSAVSDNGTNIWFGGQGSVRYTTVGAASSTELNPESVGNLNITNGQLYATSEDNFIVGKVGSGVPTTSGQTISALPGIPLLEGYQFAFADLNPSIPGPDVLYIATDISLDNTGGIQKYSLVNGSWVFNGGIGDFSDNYNGLTVKVSGTSVTVFATRKGINSASGGDLVSVTDNSGYNGSFSGTPAIIASVSSIDKMAFRGVALAPQPPPSCGQPNGIELTGIAPTSASIQWNAISGVAGYQYAVDISSTPPSSGTATVNNSATVTGLTNGTTYYVHVRTDCGNFNYSDWTTVSFTTGCQAPAAPSVSITNITSAGTADIKWNTVFGAASYEYLVSTSSTPPTSGIGTADTSLLATGLTSVTPYYVHVRSNCGSGIFSPWTTKTFSTSCFAPALTPQVVSATATITWNNVSNSTQYEYAFTSYQADPVSGITTTDTSYSIDQLKAGTHGYFHVRTRCSTGSVSTWATVAIQTDGIEAYPNPVRQMLSIKLNGTNNGNGEITISDAMGKVVQKVVLSGNSVDVDMRGMGSGTYLVRYFDGQKKYTVKVVKL